MKQKNKTIRFPTINDRSCSLELTLLLFEHNPWNLQLRKHGQHYYATTTTKTPKARKKRRRSNQAWHIQPSSSVHTIFHSSPNVQHGRISRFAESQIPRACHEIRGNRRATCEEVSHEIGSLFLLLSLTSIYLYSSRTF